MWFDVWKRESRVRNAEMVAAENRFRMPCMKFSATAIFEYPADTVSTIAIEPMCAEATQFNQTTPFLMHETFQTIRASHILNMPNTFSYH